MPQGFHLCALGLTLRVRVRVSVSVRVRVKVRVRVRMRVGTVRPHATPRDARREVGEAVEPHLQVLARLASEEELLAADGRVDWFEVGVGV